MARHNDTGKLGEQLAAEYFLGLDYVVIEKNWRSGYKEVDLIATKDGMLHFIEVKCRTSKKFGHPEENVSSKKIKLLIDAAEVYLYEKPHWTKVQFNVLAINVEKDGSAAYFLIEDVYL